MNADDIFFYCMNLEAHTITFNLCCMARQWSVYLLWCV